MIPSTYIRGRPWTLLPLPPPSEYSPTEEFGEGFFYEHVANPLIDTTVRLMDTGLPIDLSKVAELETEVDTVLSRVESTIESNPIIQQFYEWKYPKLLREHRATYQSKIHTADQYIRPFDASKIPDRSYYMYCFIRNNPSLCYDIIPPPEFVYTDIPKWTVNDVKKILYAIPQLESLVSKSVPLDDPIALEAMQLHAQHKADAFNTRHDYINRMNADSITDVVPRFNPSSAPQKHELFTDMLGYASDTIGKAYKKWEREQMNLSRQGILTDTPPPNKYSWSRKEVETLLQFTQDDESDLKELLIALVDFSFAGIIKKNFIKAFYANTIDNILYGNVKLWGTKTFRLTSNNPNLLNLPSTGSRYATAVKRCFTAPHGKLIYAIDFGALENRVIANLSHDENLSNLYLQGLDGHCMNAMYYFREEISQHMELTGDTIVDVKKFHELVESGHKELKTIRQKGKAPSFGMQYGAYPPKIADSIKCSLEEAEVIFNRYHNELYPGVTRFREDYVEPTARKDRRIHMGLGAYIRSDRPDKDIRTITNSCSQFWSILTLLTIHELNYHIDTNNLSESIQVISTIYDSIYLTVDEDPTIIKWLNDHIVPIMTKDFITEQHVKNEATGEIGYDWATMKQVSNNATLEEIQSTLTQLKET